MNIASNICILFKIFSLDSDFTFLADPKKKKGSEGRSIIDEGRIRKFN